MLCNAREVPLPVLLYPCSPRFLSLSLSSVSVARALLVPLSLARPVFLPLAARVLLLLSSLPVARALCRPRSLLPCSSVKGYAGVCWVETVSVWWVQLLVTGRYEIFASVAAERSGRDVLW